MSSYSRRSFIVAGFAVAGLSVAGCGFAPAYGPNGAANGILDSILVDEPTDRDSFLLVQQLETRLGRSSAPRLGLKTTLAVSEAQMAIAADNTTNRFNVIGRVDYVLRDLASGAVLSTGTLDSFTGYSATGTTAATQAASRDARKRLMTILADQITTRLIAIAPTLPQ